MRIGLLLKALLALMMIIGPSVSSRVCDVKDSPGVEIPHANEYDIQQGHEPQSMGDWNPSPGCGTDSGQYGRKCLQRFRSAI